MKAFNDLVRSIQMAFDPIMPLINFLEEVSFLAWLTLFWIVVIFLIFSFPFDFLLIMAGITYVVVS